MMRVLVISPDRGLEEFLRRELSPAEFGVLGSLPGAGLVHAARAVRPEIAVVHKFDDRREAAALELAILRDIRPDVRIILVSGAPSPDDAPLVESGVFYYMPASPPLRLPDVVRAAARSMREASERHLRHGVPR
jgi:hypothetical protein